MSEQDKPKNYMQALDEWIEQTVIEPIYRACQLGPEMMVTTNLSVKKAIREKVLESYHNGKAAQGPAARKHPGYAKR
jgi:hypothetical protein